MELISICKARRLSRIMAGALLALLAAACSSATAVPATAGSTNVAVELKSYSVGPNPATAKAREITFTVTNPPTDQAHELVVVQTDLAADKLPVGSDNTIDQEALKVIDEVEDVQPGKTGTVA